MDNTKTQARLFKIIIAILMVVVIGQGSFWLNAFSCHSGLDYNPVEKVKVINQQRKVITPAIDSFIGFILSIPSDK